VAAVLDLAAAQQCVDRSLSLLRRTYHPSELGGGGWYHRLDSNTPGPSATAVALNSFHLCGVDTDHFRDGMTFLKRRQVVSTDPMLNGGWAVNTSFGFPVTEATGWVARYLGMARLGLVSGSPSIGSACRWLVVNQNDDGGWGSFYGEPSRIWLTCLALRALIELNPHEPGVTAGAEWLLNQQAPCGGAWGEVATAPPTVTHTAFVLTTLQDIRRSTGGRVVSGVAEEAHGWLERHVQTDRLYDEAARVENYNISRDTDRGPLTWHASVWHPGLPFAVSALSRQPGHVDPDLLASAVQALVTSQLPAGHWPALDGSAGISMWSVWPFVQALADVLQHPPVSARARITWLTPDAFVVQERDGRDERLGALLRRSRRARWWRIARRSWATFILGLSLVLGLGLVVADVLGWKDLLLGLALPIGLLLLQEVRARRVAVNTKSRALGG
jgi:hypothetical protein